MPRGLIGRALMRREADATAERCFATLCQVFAVFYVRTRPTQRHTPSPPSHTVKAHARLRGPQARNRAEPCPLARENRPSVCLPPVGAGCRPASGRSHGGERMRQRLLIDTLPVLLAGIRIELRNRLAGARVELGRIRRYGCVHSRRRRRARGAGHCV